MINIAISGNLGFLNHLTVVPALAALDDSCWPRVLRFLFHPSSEWLTDAQFARIVERLTSTAYHAFALAFRTEPTRQSFLRRCKQLADELVQTGMQQTGVVATLRELPPRRRHVILRGIRLVVDMSLFATIVKTAMAALNHPGLTHAIPAIRG